MTPARKHFLNLANQRKALDDDYQECSECEGDGRDWYGPCMACEGTGYVLADIHEDHVRRRIGMSMEALEMAPLDRAIEKQPHAWEN